MKEILQNLAMLDAINFCKEHNIDMSGTYLKKCQRGYMYVLYKTEDNRGILSTTFYKNNVPHHYIHKN